MASPFSRSSKWAAPITRLSIPTHSVATNWASSSDFGGCPGGATPYGCIGNPLDDIDNDGLPKLLEYALAGNDADPSDHSCDVASQSYNVGGALDDYRSLTFLRNLHAQNAVIIVPQISTDLSNWTSGTSIVLVSETDNGDGTATMVYRSAVPASSEIREFFRISFTEQ